MDTCISNHTPSATWLHLCALRIQALGPLIDDDFALAVASDLNASWPGLGPEEAAEAFLQPLDAN